MANISTKPMTTQNDPVMVKVKVVKALAAGATVKEAVEVLEAVVEETNASGTTAERLAMSKQTFGC